MRWQRSRAPGVTLITSRFQIDELRDVLARDRLQPYIPREEVDDLLYHLEAVAVVVAELPDARSLSADPDDNPILATAIAGDADLIVSGDRGDMLALGSAGGIPIITAREAAARRRARHGRVIALDAPGDVQRVSAPNFQMLLAVSANSQRLSSSVRNAMWSRNSSRPRR